MSQTLHWLASITRPQSILSIPEIELRENERKYKRKLNFVFLKKRKKEKKDWKSVARVARWEVLAETKELAFRYAEEKKS